MTEITYSNVVAKYIAGLTLDLDLTTALDPRVTFSRTSLGTYYDSAGVLKYAAHNWALQSEDFNTSWTKVGGTLALNDTTAPNGSTTADRLIHTGSGSGGGLNQGITQAPGRAIYSVYAKAGTKSRVRFGTTNGSTATAVWFDLAAGTVGTVSAGWISAGIENVGSGWYRCWGVVATATAFYIHVAETDGSLTVTSTGDIYIWGAQCEYVTTATTPSTYIPTTTVGVHAPRFDYDPVTHVAKGLLIEGTTSLQGVSSQDLTHVSWTKNSATVTADQIAAPDGTTTADMITASASPASVSWSTSNSAGGTYTQSFYAKKGTSDWIYTLIQSTGDAVGTPRVWFNLNTGVIGTTEAAITAATIQNVGNGWYRCAATRVGTTGTARIIGIGLCDADNSTTVTIGRTAYAWGVMFDANASFASSYIPTPNVVSFNRAADVAVMTGSNFSSWYNQAQGTFVAEFDMLGTPGTRVLMSADDNTLNHFSLFWINSSIPTYEMRTGGSQQVTITQTAIAVGTVYKFGSSFALNDVAVCINGGTISADTAAVMPTPTQLRIGHNSTTSQLNGHLRRIRFWNTAKSDAELITLTAPPAAPITWDAATVTTVTLSGGNLVVTSAAGSAGGARGADAVGKTTGKHYFEVTVTTDAGGGNTGFGVGTTASTYAAMGNNATSGGICFVNGGLYANGTNSGKAITNPVNGDVVGIAVDLDNHKIWYVNRTTGGGAPGWNGSLFFEGSSTENPATNAGGLTLPTGTLVPFCTFNAAGNVFTANFGASAFTGAVPSGFASGWIA